MSRIVCGCHRVVMAGMRRMRPMSWQETAISRRRLKLRDTGRSGRIGQVRLCGGVPSGGRPGRRGAFHGGQADGSSPKRHAGRNHTMTKEERLARRREIWRFRMARMIPEERAMYSAKNKIRIAKTTLEKQKEYAANRSRKNRLPENAQRNRERQIQLREPDFGADQTIQKEPEDRSGWQGFRTGRRPRDAGRAGQREPYTMRRGGRPHAWASMTACGRAGI